MSAHCCGHHVKPPRPEVSEGYRVALWIVLAINAVMFVIEIGAGFLSGSASLQADSLDFLSDAANCGVSLFVVGMASRARAYAALAKAASMLVFGAWVLAVAAWHLWTGTVPEA